jgi:hypothetical protein
MSNVRQCRCNRPMFSDGKHPCHGKAYTCTAAGTSRFITNSNASLAGMQPKVSAYQTWVCDECWDEYCKLTKDN